jgi:hypothetical protein
VHQRSNGYQRNARLQTVPQTALHCVVEVRTEVRGALDTEQCLSGAAPDYLVPLEDKASNGQLLQNPNGWVTWLAHRTVSGGAPVRCAHRQQPAPTVVWWLRAINTPQPPPPQVSKISEHHIQYKGSSIHS